MIIWEHIDAAEVEVSDQGSKSNLDMALAEISGRNYECQLVAVNTTHLGILHIRQRCLMIAMLTIATPAITIDARGVMQVVSALRSLIKVCQRDPPCASEFLLERGHPLVAAELRRWQTSPCLGKRAPYAMDAPIKAAAALGAPWASIKTPPWLKTPPPGF